MCPCGSCSYARLLIGRQVVRFAILGELAHLFRYESWSPGPKYLLKHSVNLPISFGSDKAFRSLIMTLYQNGGGEMRQ